MNILLTTNTLVFVFLALDECSLIEAGQRCKLRNREQKRGNLKRQLASPEVNLKI